MIKSIFIISIFISFGNSQSLFPKIVYFDSFSATEQDTFLDYHPRHYNYYAEELYSAGFNIIHTDLTNSPNDPNYLETLQSYNLLITSSFIGDSNKPFINKGYQEIWPVGYNTNTSDFEKHLNNAHYEILDATRAEYYHDNGGTFDDVFDDTYFIRSMPSVHEPGQVLDGSGFWAGYWRYSANIHLLINGFIDNLENVNPEDTVVTFKIYETDNSTRLFNFSDDGDLSEHEESTETLRTYYRSFLVEDFETPGQYEQLTHENSMFLNEFSLQNDFARTHVDMEWHGNVDFYLDGFELRSTYNYRLFTDLDSIYYHNQISNEFSDVYNLNGGQLDILHRFYYDEPKFNQYKSLGKLSDLAEYVAGTNFLSATGKYGHIGVSQYKYIEYAKPKEVLYNNYVIKGNGFGGDYTSHNSDSIMGNNGNGRTLQSAFDTLMTAMQLASYQSYTRNTPFFNTIQTQSERRRDNNSQRYRNPTPSEISAQVWLSLAHNAKGLMYFLFSTGEFDYRHHGLMTIDANNNGLIDPGEKEIFDPSLGPYIPNEKYFEVQKLNHEIDKIASHILELDWLNTYSTEVNNPDFELNPDPSHILVENIYSQEYPDNPYIQIGHFSHSQTNEKYFILVNKRCCLENDGECFEYEDQTLTVTLDIDSEYLLEDVLASLEPWDGDGNRVAYRSLNSSNSSFTVSLKPGEGRLFRLTDGINGFIDKDSYWSGNIEISNDLELNSDNEITIYPGTSISIGNNVTLHIEGNLISDGTEDNPVTITGNGSIMVDNGNLTMSNTEMENIGLIWAKSSAGELSNCQVNTNQGMVIEGGSFEINNSTFESNNVGLLVASRPSESRGVASIRNSQFNNSVYGLATSYGAIVNLYNNQFSNNEYGIYSDAFSEPWLFQEDANLGCSGNNNVIINNNIGIGVYQDAQPWLGIYWDLSNNYEGHNRINNTHDIENNTFHDRPIYAQVNNWNSGSNCNPSSPNSLLDENVISHPTVYDIYYDGPPTWEDDNVVLRMEASGDYNGAASYYREIVESDPTHEDALWALSGLVRCMGKAGQLQEVISLLENYVSIYSGTDVEKYARSYGITKQIVKGDYPKAETMIASFMSDYPNSEFEPKIQYESALITELMGQTAGRITQGNVTDEEKYQAVSKNFPNTGIGLLAKIKSGDALPEQIEKPVPDDFSLLSNYPNPFNPSTTITYTLPEYSKVILSIYDLTGREIITLVNSMKPTGSHHVEWNGNDMNGKSVSTGVYLYSINIVSAVNGTIYNKNNKMVYLK